MNILNNLVPLFLAITLESNSLFIFQDVVDGALLTCKTNSLNVQDFFSNNFTINSLVVFIFKNPKIIVSSVEVDDG